MRGSGVSCRGRIFVGGCSPCLPLSQEAAKAASVQEPESGAVWRRRRKLPSRSPRRVSMGSLHRESCRSARCNSWRRTLLRQTNAARHSSEAAAEQRRKLLPGNGESCCKPQGLKYVAANGASCCRGPSGAVQSEGLLMCSRMGPTGKRCSALENMHHTEAHEVDTPCSGEH